MDKSFLNTIMNSNPQAGWKQILAEVWKIFADPLNPVKADTLTTERDKKAGALDTLLSGAVWDLWYEIKNSRCGHLSIFRISGNRNQMAKPYFFWMLFRFGKHVGY